MSRFPCKLPSMHTLHSHHLRLPYKKYKELCRSVTVWTETNYVNFNDRTVTHLLKLPIQGINIIALKKAVCENRMSYMTQKMAIQSIVSYIIFFRKKRKIRKKKKTLKT